MVSDYSFSYSLGMWICRHAVYWAPIPPIVQGHWYLTGALFRPGRTARGKSWKMAWKGVCQPRPQDRLLVQNGGRRNPWLRLPQWLQKFVRISSRKDDEMSLFCLNNGFRLQKTNRAAIHGNNVWKSHFIMCHLTKYSTIRGVLHQPWPGVSPTTILNEKKALRTRLVFCQQFASFISSISTKELLIVSRKVDNTWFFAAFPRTLGELSSQIGYKVTMSGTVLLNSDSWLLLGNTVYA